MLDNIYNQRILELAGNIPRLGRLPQPDATASAYSKLCGSTITVDLKLRDGKVADYAHELKACALGQASASIMARNVVGSTPQELREARDAVRRMRKENGPAATGKWADAAVLEPVRDYKARHGSTMLAFDAVADAVGKAEA
jgi:NifU-like protein involved in Fe-S cluster formation